MWRAGARPSARRAGSRGSELDAAGVRRLGLRFTMRDGDGTRLEWPSRRVSTSPGNRTPSASGSRPATQPTAKAPLRRPKCGRAPVRMNRLLGRALASFPGGVRLADDGRARVCREREDDVHLVRARRVLPACHHEGDRRWIPAAGEAVREPAGLRPEPGVHRGGRRGIRDPLGLQLQLHVRDVGGAQFGRPGHASHEPGRQRPLGAARRLLRRAVAPGAVSSRARGTRSAPETSSIPTSRSSAATRPRPRPRPSRPRPSSAHRRA